MQLFSLLAYLLTLLFSFFFLLGVFLFFFFAFQLTTTSLDQAGKTPSFARLLQTQGTDRKKNILSIFYCLYWASITQFKLKVSFPSWTYSVICAQVGADGNLMSAPLLKLHYGCSWQVALCERQLSREVPVWGQQPWNSGAIFNLCPSLRFERMALLWHCNHIHRENTRK